MDNRTLGTQYEIVAKDHLIKYGAQIVEMNYHFHKMGEIDIICYDNVIEYGVKTKYLCFCEVKYRKNNKGGGAIYAVDYNKQKKISAVAMGYVKAHKIPLDHPMRFDVIAIDGEKINWIKNAFYYIGN